MAVYLHNVQLSESSRAQIRFQSVAFQMIIFPFQMLKSVTRPSMTEYDQRVIIRFLSNEGIAADEIVTRFQAQFAEHAYKLRTVRLWIGEVRFGRQDLHDEIRTGRPPLDDIDAKILAILDKSPFGSARSIAERLFVSHTTGLYYLHLSVGQIISFALGPASVDRGFTPKTEGRCTHYVAAIAYCPARWLASSCDW
jgi:hypothetical protein